MSHQQQLLKEEKETDLQKRREKYEEDQRIIMNRDRMMKRKIVVDMKWRVTRTTTRKSESTTSNIEKNGTLFSLIDVGLRTEETNVGRRNKMSIERKKFMMRTTIRRRETPMSLTITSNNNCAG